MPDYTGCTFDLVEDTTQGGYRLFLNLGNGARVQTGLVGTGKVEKALRLAADAAAAAKASSSKK
jgi:hypothetical protein